MKNQLILFVFLFCASISYGQTPITNEQSASNAATLFHYKGVLTGDVAIKIPSVDTLNHPATRFLGSLTIRPQDTASRNPPVYMSNGVYWIPFLSGSGTITSYGKNISNDSTILIMSDGSRYAASDESGATVLSAIAPLYYDNVTHVLSADTTTAIQGLATHWYADSAFVRVKAIDSLTARFYRKNGDSADVSFELIGGSGGSGALQGLQDVITVDPVMTKSDTINAYDNLLSISVTNDDSTGNVPSLNLLRNTDGTPQDGISQSIDFATESTDGSTYPQTKLASRWSNVNVLSRTSEFAIMGVDSTAPMADVLTVKGNGQITLNNKYTIGSFAGIFKYQVGLDDAGHLVTASPTTPPTFSADAPIIYDPVTGNFSLDTTTANTGVATHFYADSAFIRFRVVSIDTLRFYRKNGDSSDVLYDITGGVASYGKNISGDSTVLTLRDGTRLAASDNTGGGGGGGTAIPFVKQTHTAGATVAVTDSTTWLVVNPATILAALTVTLPVSPTDGQEILISFGGTITSGGVVTAITINPTPIDSNTPDYVMAGEHIAYKYNSSNSKWYRIN